MKFNFKRIASVLTGAVMLSSTVALAAAATTYPAPFVAGGTADVAVVYGELAALSDVTAARKVSTALGTSQLAAATSVTTPAATSGDGDVFELERTSDKLHLGSDLSSAFSRALAKGDMPTLLADGVYTDYAGTDYDYTQKVTVNSNLMPTQFSDTAYKDEAPTLGIRIADDAEVLNYTLDFKTNPVMNNDLEQTDLTVLGKKYLIFDQNNGSTPSVTLLDAAATVLVPEGETKSVTVNGKTYQVSVSVSSATRVKVTVNGKTSTGLDIGGTFKIENGVYAGVKDITSTTKESQINSAEVSIGTGKIFLENGQRVEVNDDNVDGLYGFVTKSGADLDKITLQWRTSEDSFVTSDSSITMPAFNALKLSSTGMFYPDSEDISITNDGSDTVKLTIPIKDGDVSIPILTGNGSAFSYIGKSATKTLWTSQNAYFNYTADTGDDMFVISWANTKDSESYLLRASNFDEDDNSTQIEYNKDGSWTDLSIVTDGESIELGSAVVTVNHVAAASKRVEMHAETGVNFNTLYSAGGLKVFLPVAGASAATTRGALNITNNTLTYPLQFTEESATGDVAGGTNFNVTLGFNADGKVKVTSVTGTNGSAEIGESNVLVSQVYSGLATTFTHDTDPDQPTAKITYHGDESYFKLLLTAASVSVGPGDGTVGGDLFVTDAEMAKFQDKNLIVIGGSCINKVAAKVLGSDTPVCGADFTTKSGVKAGEYLVKTYQSPYNTAKVATLVAGYEAAETTNAADFLLTQSVDTTVGAEYPNGVKKVVGPTA